MVEKKIVFSEPSSLEAFLGTEIERISTSVPKPDGGWRQWTGAEELVRGYTDQQLVAILTQTRISPNEVSDPGNKIETRSYSQIDGREVPLGETWHDLIRRMASRIIRFELDAAENPTEEVTTATSEEKASNRNIRTAPMELVFDLYERYLTQGLTDKDALELAKQNVNLTLQYGQEDWTL